MYDMHMVLLVASLVLRQSATPPTPSKLEQKLTLTQKATSLRQMLDLIQVQSGLKFEMSRELAREIVLVSVHEKPLKLVLADLAKVCDAKVAFTETGATFSVDGAKRAAEELAIEQRRLANLNKAIPFLEKLTRPAVTKKGEKIPREISQVVCAKVALALPRYQIAKLKPGQRLVFSTFPNRMQFQLNIEGLSDLVSAWISEYNAMIESTAKAEGQAESEPTSAAIDPALLLLMRGKQPGKITSAPAKLLAIVGSGDLPSVEVKVYDADGKVILSGAQGLDKELLGSDEALTESAGQSAGDRPGVAVAVPTGSDEGSPKITSVGDVIELSAESKKFQRLFDFSSNSNPIEDPAFLAIVDRPDRYDPLSFAPSDYFLHRAEKRSLDIVANMQDTLVQVYRDARYGDILDPKPGVKPTKEEPSRPMPPIGENADFSVNSQESEGILTVWPGDPPTSRRNRIDRSMLAALVGERRKNLVVSLDSLAEFAMGNPEPSYLDGLGASYFAAQIPQLQGGFMGGGSGQWNGLRLYGRIPSGVRQQLRSGQVLPISSLGGDLQPLLADGIFGQTVPITSIAEAGKMQEAMRKGDFDALFTGSMGFANPGDQEPTNLFPNGLPTQGVVKFQVTSEPYFFTTLTAYGMKGSYPLGIMELGITEAMKDIPEMSGGDMGPPQIEKLFFGQRDSIIMTIQLLPDSGFTTALFDHHPPDKSQSYTLSTLPAEQKGQINSLAEKVKKSKFMAMIRTMGAMGREGPKKP